MLRSRLRQQRHDARPRLSFSVSFFLSDFGSGSISPAHGTHPPTALSASETRHGCTITSQHPHSVFLSFFFPPQSLLKVSRPRSRLGYGPRPLGASNRPHHSTQHPQFPHALIPLVSHRSSTNSAWFMVIGGWKTHSRQVGIALVLAWHSTPRKGRVHRNGHVHRALRQPWEGRKIGKAQKHKKT